MATSVLLTSRQGNRGPISTTDLCVGAFSLLSHYRGKSYIDRPQFCVLKILVNRRGIVNNGEFNKKMCSCTKNPNELCVNPSVA
jgi:hypothetical protein